MLIREKIQVGKNKMMCIYINFNGKIVVYSVLTQEMRYLQIENLSIVLYKKSNEQNYKQISFLSTF